MQTKTKKSEAYSVAVLLAVAGGFLDTYTYICRGEVFANAQTGNMVLCALHLARLEWLSAAYYVVPIFSFFAGILVAEWVKNRPAPSGRFHWRHATLGLEIVLLFMVAFIPCGVWNPVVNCCISFVCAVQVESFRKVQGNPFASTMCTGNLRSGTEALYYSRAQQSTPLFRKSMTYYSIILFFMTGAALGVLATTRWSRWAVLLPAVLQIVAFWAMCDSDANQGMQNPLGKADTQEETK